MTPTSNHNLKVAYLNCQTVVYLLTPTSNHNLLASTVSSRLLYIFWLLHQTTTVVFWELLALWLYIFWLLHQTTTPSSAISLQICCISFDSYIKPQLASSLCCAEIVVYLLTPTSNHNYVCCVAFLVPLYIFWLLHQTTTGLRDYSHSWSCISFDSYIKPQLIIVLL